MGGLKNTMRQTCFFFLLMSLYDQIETGVYSATGKKVVVDSELFASKKSHAMIKSHQNNVDMMNGNNPCQRFGLNCQATSVRQLSCICTQYCCGWRLQRLLH